MNDTCYYAYGFEGEPYAHIRGLKASERGGIVIFSLDVKPERVKASNGLLRFLKCHWEAFRNREWRHSKVREALSRITVREGEQPPTGCSIGNIFTGIYNQIPRLIRSLAVEVLFISSRQLDEFAMEIAKEFNQESVLVRDHTNGEVRFVGSV